jgi:hypothetical protein
MTRSPVRRTFAFLAFMTFVPVVVMGCPKKEPAVIEEAAAPPPPSSAPTVTELMPLTDDAGPDASDAAPEAGKKVSAGPVYNANQLKIKQCCNAMRAEAAAMGTASPEAFQIKALAAQCDVFVTQVGPQGNAPELGQLRQILQSVKLPTACQM